jgi:hypothetical protein
MMMHAMTMTPTAPVVERSEPSGASSPSWHAPAAWGAGLIEIALGAGAIIADSGGAATRAVGFVLLTFGVAALVWGALSLHRGHLVAPNLVVAGALAGVLLSAVALALDPVRISVFAVAAASALLVLVALAAAAGLRRGSRTGRADAGSPRIVELIVAAVLVAALVTPALSATEAGRLAPDHGEHGVMVDPAHH